MMIVAYLSLWLCHFIFLFDDDIIHLGTYKVASRMVVRVIYSLVSLLLAHIYEALMQTFNSYNDSKDLGKAKAHFPSHYLFT